MPHKIAKTKVLRYFFKLLVSPADDAGGSLHAKKQSVPFFLAKVPKVHHFKSVVGGLI